VAIRDIATGEELTYNYGYEVNDEPAEPCHCGAPICCGYILAPQYWTARYGADSPGSMPTSCSATWTFR
jgi:hypothetical protein